MQLTITLKIKKFNNNQKNKVMKTQKTNKQKNGGFMKTNVNYNELLSVLERSDYKRLTETLAKKCEFFANLIIDKMLDLDLNELDDLVLTKIKTYSGFSTITLSYNDSGDLSCCKAYSGGGKNGLYFAGDFNCWITYAKNNEALKFLNNLKHYLKLLDEIETKKCNEIEAALKEVEDLDVDNLNK